MADYADLLSFDFLNKFGSFPKLAKNGITLIVFDTFPFKANYTNSINTIQFFAYYCYNVIDTT